MSFENVFNCSTIYYLNFCPMHLLHSSSFYNECQSQSAKVLLLQAFFNAFIVASVVGHYRFIDFWSQKPWVFYQNASVSSPEPLSFFQNTGVLKNWSKIFEETAVFCRKFVQKALNIAFFLCASCGNCYDRAMADSPRPGSPSRVVLSSFGIGSFQTGFLSFC